MKHLLFVAMALLLFSGCAYKNEALTLESYKAEYAGPLSKDKKTIYLRTVKDLRANKSIIGYIDQKSPTTINFYSNENFAEKYSEGLGYALNLAGFNIDATAQEASLVVEVYIKDIELIYNDKNFDTNLKGEIEIEVIVRKGDEVITQNFRQKGGKWIAPSHSSKDLEPFLYTLFADSIDQIVTRLTRF
ncbi:YajG family lipoprotein [Sulfurospirillum oryzae]|uniref:YajG family lipoprotein n=1 Tax=Sulfurospirillum oryzae TaxID=2976535 RepID=UPI0021E7A167|nr:YajG family lipoprotein [Sulfurospirillum oryzae]